MNMERMKNIVKMWDELEAENPNKSTEWLLQMTCDKFKEVSGVTIDHGAIAIALALAGNYDD